jgi:Ser/Thr protein kinase RdoA (MazF antagonist)
MQDPWLSLSFDSILTQTEKVTGLNLSNLVIQRNSYVNRVYELSVKQSEQKLIIKFYRPGRWTSSMIKEEHDFLRTLTSAELPVIEPLIFNNKTLFNFNDINFTVFPKKGGRAIDELTEDSWTQVGRLLGRMHLIGKTIHNSNRIVWTPEKATKNSLNYLLKNNFIPKDYIASLERVAEFFMQQASVLFKQEPLFLIHGDCHLGNLIHRPNEGIYLVDFDDMCIGPAVQDLWMLLPGNANQCDKEINWFIEGYETFSSFNLNSLQLIPMLKVMRMIHFAGWCALQSNDVSFREHFPDWGSNQYWNQLIREIQENVYSAEE